MLLRPATLPLSLGIVVAAVVIALETLVVVLLEDLSPGETFEPVYLLGILVVSMVWGLGLAVATSLVSAIALAIFDARSGGQVAPFDSENGVLVVVFLVAALCTNFIAGLARVRAFEADQRRREAEEARTGLQESRDRISVLAQQQAALRRVATGGTRRAQLRSLLDGGRAVGPRARHCQRVVVALRVRQHRRPRLGS
ncbi:DUF4118 domain-containing protein [Nocardia pseudovaccinii]|uniref:DUF4118 domain-containing protein n=1 Tax=Nocardia pseudovaccinii TaxID=189540 RepID=UPI001FE23239|nr:DUF4118 domain-containing protein [Nocardia pseudovaccinii]